MDKVRLNVVVVFVVIAMVALLIIQAVHTKDLYNQESRRFKDLVTATMYRIAIRHEKAEDIRHVFQLANQNFNGSYKDILKEEYQNILSSKDMVTIQDTVIYQNGVPENYVYITGEAQDSMGGVKAEQRVLARDTRKLKDFNSQSGGSADYDMAEQMDQKVVLKMFEKAKFVNEMMIQAFRDNVIDNPEANLDFIFLDSVIRTELREDHLPNEYSFMVIGQNNKPIQPIYSLNNYDTTINIESSYEVDLFPRNVFSENLKLHIKFPSRNKVLLKELWVPLLVNLFLVVMIVSALVFMFKTILTQNKLAELKNDFISNMTHEFRTPISTISLACQAMDDPDMSNVNDVNAKTKPYVKMIREENKRLGVLVDAILQSNTIDKGELRLKKEELLVNEIVFNIVEKMKFKAQAKGGDVKLRMDPEMVHIYADRVHFTNCISNLIDNAKKYSEGAPQVVLELKNLPNSIQIIVSDKGIGIKKEHINKIFDKLYRVPTGNLHDVKGFGLGLSYVKAICDLHGWSISVQSKHGIGSTFTIEIKK